MTMTNKPNDGTMVDGKRVGGEYILTLADRNAKVVIALNPTEALSLSQSIKASLTKMREEWAKANPPAPQTQEAAPQEPAAEQKPQ